MKNKPYVSIVVCIYNGEKTLQSAIDSLLEQDYPKDRYEIILVDDGSNDRSAQICREILKRYEGKYPKITYVFQKNGGLSRARNTGIFLAQGDIIAFIDQDAVADHVWICNIVIPFLSSKTVYAIGGEINNLDSNSWFAWFIHKVHYQAAVLSSDCGIVGTNMAFRKEAFEYTSGFFNVFNSRGDETAFIVDLFNKVPDMERRHIQSAIVYHKHPGSFVKWMKERFHNGKLACDIEKHIMSNGNNNKKATVLIKSAMKMVSLLFIPYTLILITGWGHVGIYSILISMWFMRCINIRRYLFRSVKQGVLGKLWVFPILIVIILGQISCDIGYIYEGIGSFWQKEINIEKSTGEIIEVLKT
jgi:glycosyltransferase involved in cell wall biosynthesis